jgi:hypothetical protein
VPADQLLITLEVLRHWMVGSIAAGLTRCA